MTEQKNLTSNAGADAQSSKMTKLIEILDQMLPVPMDELEPLPARQEIVRAWAELKTLYSDIEFRHSYFILSQYLGALSPDVRDALPEFIRKTLTYAEQQAQSNPTEQVQRPIQSGYKLLDHVQLECLRLNRTAQMNFCVEQYKNTYERTQSMMEDVRKEGDELKKKVSGFHEQSITILGIFAAVIIGFIAQLSMFAKGFETLTPANVYAVLFYCVIAGVLVFDTLFMLMFCIARIANVALNVKHKHTPKLWVFRTIVRYPYVYLFNLLAVSVAVILFFLNQQAIVSQ